MDISEDFIKSLQNMNQRDLQRTLKNAVSSLPREQQQALKNLTRDKSKLESVKEKLTAEDIEGLRSNMDSAASLKAFLNREDIQKRLRELL